MSKGIKITCNCTVWPKLTTVAKGKAKIVMSPFS